MHVFIQICKKGQEKNGKKNSPCCAQREFFVLGELNWHNLI